MKLPTCSFSLRGPTGPRLLRTRTRPPSSFVSLSQKETINLYKKCRNRVVSELRSSNIEYFNQYFAEHKSNMKMLWTGIKAIINIKRNKFYDISLLPKMVKELIILKILLRSLISNIPISKLPKLMWIFLVQGNLHLTTWEKRMNQLSSFHLQY